MSASSSILSSADPFPVAARPTADQVVGPSDDAKYRGFEVRRRWPLLLLVAAQATIIVDLLRAVLTGNELPAALVLLAVLVPTVLVAARLATSRNGMDLERHVVFVERWRKETTAVPSIDVLIPWAGESVLAVDLTARSASALDWPGAVQVHVVDLAGGVGRRRLATAVGARFWSGLPTAEGLDRTAMERTAGQLAGDLVVDLRPGSVVRPDFLWETAPYLLDQAVGAVQGDEVVGGEGQRGPSRFVAVLGELFARWIQPTRSRRGRARVCGSGVLYRREALAKRAAAQTGALDGGDPWVAHLRRAGWRTLHVPVALVAAPGPLDWPEVTRGLYTQVRRGRSALRPLLHLAPGAALVAVLLPLVIALWLRPASLAAESDVRALAAAWAACGALAALGGGRSGMRVLPYVALLPVVTLVAVADRLADSAARSIGLGAGRSPDAASAPRRVAVLGVLTVLALEGALWGGLTHYWAVVGTVGSSGPVLAFALALVLALVPAFVSAAVPAPRQSGTGVVRRTPLRSAPTARRAA